MSWLGIPAGRGRKGRTRARLLALATSTGVAANERLARITAPALIAAGADDVVIPAVNSDLLAAALPGARRELFDGGGHAFMAQEPVKLAALINSWLGR